ncbi:hypothetical protein C7M71_018880 [Peterkaempfera bronchialis]|uniref:Uncharacterized protein n=1 Tax=Peterkaempfera bronchialis TaxID=2126346 RepID=A0A345SZL5_9ACTN|nr:hypothetical protein C7M71_018880 [Peterkaempfera bronchialis]
MLPYGEVQKEVIAAVLRDDFGVEAVFAPSRVVCLEREIPADVLGPVTARPAALGAHLRDPVREDSSWLLAGDLPARRVDRFTRQLPGLSHGEGVWWSQPSGDRPVSGPAPTRERPDGNPLNRQEYPRHLAQRTG